MLARVSKVANGIQWNYEIFDGEPGATDRILIATKQFWKAEIAEPQ